MTNYTPPRSICPVSVIIPMYNAEKYIADCLKSLLAQTLQNLEVIVVDDCSTDSSYAIVESYIPKFGGRLKLLHRKKNWDSCAIPRNQGFALSRGEYIFFMDADDLFAKATALEELYALAKNFSADVVYCEKYFGANHDLKKILLTSYQRGSFVDEPTFETENLAERVQGILHGRFMGASWLHLVARDFLVENKLDFPPMKGHEDTIHTWMLILYAKKFLRVPNAVYVYRQYEDSLSKKDIGAVRKIVSHVNSTIQGVHSLKKVMDEIEFFRQNPVYFYELADYFIQVNFAAVLEKSTQLQPFELYEIIKQGLDDEVGDPNEMISLLCTVLNTQQRISAVNQQRFNQFAAQAQKRITELEAQLKINKEDF